MNNTSDKNNYLKAKSDSKIYSFDAGNFDFSAGDDVLFETEVCQEIGVIVAAECAKKCAGDKSIDSAVIIRKMTDKDREEDKAKQTEGRSHLGQCREIIAKHKLPMELLGTDLSFDGKKLTFYFTSPSRVDFRILVSELATKFQKLIRLQQIGTRDRARCVGGIGRCGEAFCCCRFLKGELDNVSMDMAYDQNIGMMGPNRSTGACGKLMCCLRFELDYYKDQKKKLPAVGKTISTERGKGIVTSQNILQNKVTVQLEDKTFLEVDWK